jgi:hypothetical protein
LVVGLFVGVLRKGLERDGKDTGMCLDSQNIRTCLGLGDDSRAAPLAVAAPADGLEEEEVDVAVLCCVVGCRWVSEGLNDQKTHNVGV